MRKILILTLVFGLHYTLVHSQLWKMKRLEVSAGMGTTQFFGDVGGFTPGENLLGFKDFILTQTRFNINTSARYRIIKPVSLRVNLASGYFHSSDAKGSNEGRAFESTTMFFEPSVMGEYYFIRNSGEKSYHFMKGSGKSKQQSYFQMIDFYAFTGIGELFYKINPNNKLESYMKHSSGRTMVIPLGVGASLNTGDYYFGIELGARYTFSDNIDGYTSAYSKSNDMYYLLNFNFTYKIRTGENGLPLFMSTKRRR